jgi:hypothetical protein
MVTFSIRVKENRVKGDLAQFRAYVGKLTGDLLLQEACLTARSALKYAPPLVPSGGKGDTAAAGKTGERAIDKDVRSIFAEPGSTLQSVFARSGLAGAKSAFAKWRSKPLIVSSSTLLSKIYFDHDESRAFGKAKNIFYGKPNRSQSLDNMGAMSTIHKQQRKNGRILREGRPSKEVKRYPYIVKGPLINQYVKLRSRAIGKLKSGWWEIISKYGTGLNIFGRIVDAGAKGLPKYITRHKGPGTLVKNMSGHSKKVRITNQIGDADAAGLRTNTAILVNRDRIAAIAKRPYQVYANRLVRNWNNKLRPGA